MTIKRVAIHTDTEKDIITGMIVNDAYLSAVMRLGIKRQYFRNDFARKVFEWIRAYYNQYGKAPNRDIKPIFDAERPKMKEAEAELIGQFLSSLSDAYDESKELDDFLLNRTQQYFRERNLSIYAEKILTCLERGKTDEAEKIAADFRRGEKDIPIIDGASWLEQIPEPPDQILYDTFDKGDKVAVIGSSKLRKSFFLLQMALSLASGKDFLTWECPKPRKVFYIQFEIQEHHFHNRVRRLGKTIGITPADLENRFHIVNARGLGITGEDGINKIAAICDDYRPDVIFLDPLYKIAAGIENAAEDFKLILNAFDKLALKTGASVIFVHHDTKGSPGDKNIRDRGAGSNVLGRDYDVCITLTAHGSGNPDLTAIDTLLRNYRPQEPFAIRWTEDEETRGYCFEPAKDVLPTKQTSANRNRQPDFSIEQLTDVACATLATAIMDIALFKESFKDKTGLPYRKIEDFVRLATDGDIPELETKQERRRGMHKKVISQAGIIRGGLDNFRKNRNHHGGF